MTSSLATLPDGARLAVHTEGEGPALLLVSGLGGTAAFWSPLLPLLAPCFRVIRFDQRGIGASTRGSAPVTIDRLAEDALAVLAHAGTGRAIAVGHSTGGAIVQRMARRDGARLAGAALTGTWLGPNRYMRELFAARLEMLGTAPRAYAAAGVFLGYPADWLDAHWDALEAAVAAAPASAAQGEVLRERIAALLAFDGAGDVPHLTMPVFVTGAEDDLIVPAFLQRGLAAALPHAASHVFPTGGHFFPLTRAAEFAARLIAWGRGLA